MAFISVDKAADILRSGGVVAVPTETVYGLAANATNSAAINKIYTIKNRPADNPLICHFPSFTEAKKYVTFIPAYVTNLAMKFSPGPLSFLLNIPVNSSLLPATGGRQNVIVRVPAHPLLLSLLRKLDFPLAAPSANMSGRFSPTTAKMVEEGLGNKLDGIIDGGECDFGLESTIIDCRQESIITLLRPGVIGAEDIQRALNDSSIQVIEFPSSVETTPGAKYRHYAPVTPVTELNFFEEIKDTGKPIAVLLVEEQEVHFNQWKLKHPEVAVTVVKLGSLKNIEETGKQLYKHFYDLDGLKLSNAYLLKTDWGSSVTGLAVANRINKILSR